MTIYEEARQNIILDNDSIAFPNWEFMVFLAIVTTPMIVFRGSYKDFLEYVQMKVTDNNLDNLKEALQSLADRDIISFIHHITNNISICQRL